ncbi:hypothetical protein [Actinoplanes auranticolor]|uniref:hypothetical protein n=1 Tax=Actinoplanes auranticolor TaxID=47988 RepID=UPI001BB3E272|nr:hypothetical protein [Actinoplanes auranticolor]
MARFLEEVRTKQIDWAAHARRIDNPGVSPAMTAIVSLSWPRTVLDAVDRAGLQAFASLGLSRADFADPLSLGEVKVSLMSAVKAIAAGDQLAFEHRQALLEPFATAGFESAAAALAAPGALVAQFLTEVRDASVEDWRRYLQAVSGQPRGSRRAVFRTLELGLDPAVETAIDRAADDAYRSLRLSGDQFPGQEARFVALQTDVIAAAQVIAAGDAVRSEPRQVLLQPFADAGFEAAGEALSTG